MPSKYDTLQRKQQDEQKASQDLAQQLETFLSPLLLVLDTVLDKRLVRTVVQTCVAILRFRNTQQGLLLSELGSYMDGYQGYSRSAPAGTKRLSNLLRSLKWNIFHLDRYLLEEADHEVKRLRQQGQRILCLWDDSVLEKPESSSSEGLCPVISSKAKRRNRSKKGQVFNLPTLRPIMVTGMHWTSGLIAGMEGPVKVAVMSWWTTKGDYATKLRSEQEEMLRKGVRKWGDLLVHVFDRGYASGPWLHLLQSLKLTFVIRWIKTHHVFDYKGEEKKLWQVGLGKKYLAHKQLYDVQSGEKLPCDIWWTSLRHGSYDYPLWLVKVRMKKHVWYLVTNEPVQSEAQAWEIVFIYKRRWQIETSFRYGKSELAMESPRVWAWETRLKLLGLVTLVYAFLLHLLNPVHHERLQAILRFKCHRTGKRCRDIPAPLYRVRWAISRLWNDHRPLLGSILPPNLQTLQALASFRC
jgi:hypothetical protein